MDARADVQALRWMAVCLCAVLNAPVAAAAVPASTRMGLGTYFEANRGQAPADIAFVGRAGGRALGLATGRRAPRRRRRAGAHDLRGRCGGAPARRARAAAGPHELPARPRSHAVAGRRAALRARPLPRDLGRHRRRVPRRRLRPRPPARVRLPARAGCGSRTDRAALRRRRRALRSTRAATC